MKPCLALRLLATAPLLLLPAAHAGTVTNNPGAPLSTWVVKNSAPATNAITFAEFLNEVARANLDYAAQRYNVDIAKAAVAIGQEFPNPTLNLGGSRDMRFHGDQTQPESRSVGIDQTVEYFNKRKWRVRVADQTYRAAAATLEDFLRNLKMDASEAYVNALATQRTLDQQRQATDYLSQLVVAQQHRLKAGDIGETDFTQSRLDELQSQSDLLKAQDDAQTARLALCTFLGRQRGQTVLVPHGQLELKPHPLELSQLLVNALLNRPDLVALRHTRDSAVSGIDFAKASRMPDVDVGLAYDYTTASQNKVNPSPSDGQLALSLSLPLPLWNNQRAEIRTARFTAEQAEKTLQSAELKAEVQLRQNFSTYQFMCARVQKYQSELLKGADDVLAAKRFSYEHGQTTLLDLLDAQRNDNDIHQGYTDALADQAKALLELERAAGLWDIEF
jgi:cobalt-zinc-cadmium efflux system outer membrane protein